MRLHQSLIGLPALLFLSAIAGCVGVQAPFTRAFVAFDAEFEGSGLHEANRRSLRLGQPPAVSREFVLLGHQVKSGKGYILAIREHSSGSFLKTDQASFRDLTVFIPPQARNLGGEYRVGRQTEALAFWSTGSINSPGSNGCFGYGADGSLSFERVSAEQYAVTINISIDPESPLNWPGECDSQVHLSSRVMAQVRSLRDLRQLDRDAGLTSP